MSSEFDKGSWPPPGFEAVGDYAFQPPFVPTQEQVEEIELFIFSQPEFAGISEKDCRLNVIRLATGRAMTENTFSHDDGSEQIGFTPMIGGVVVRSLSIRREGSIITTYDILKPEADQ